MSTSPSPPSVLYAVAAFAVGVLALMAFALAASPVQARRLPVLPPPGTPKLQGCGVLKVASNPWVNFIDGAGRDTGDHWIVSRTRSGGPCSTARSFARTLVDDVRFFNGNDSPKRVRGNLCRWNVGSGHEIIAPFQEITCAIHERVGRRRVLTIVGAQVDPDPRFITPVSAGAARVDVP